MKLNKREKPGIDATLAALADPARRQVIDLLRERPRRAGELAVSTQLAPPLMSRHLKMLRVAGLVDEERDELDSRVRIYRLRHEAMNDLKAWLEETESLWARQLKALKSHIENKKR